jgi:hypothetical protein
MSNLCRVNLEVWESVESRVSSGKMLQKVPVALLVTAHRCFVYISPGARRMPKFLRLRPKVQIYYQLEQVPEDGGGVLKIQSFLSYGHLNGVSIW